MRAAILLVALALPLGASASTSSRVGVRVVVLPTVRFSQEIGAPVRKMATAGGAFYVLPMKSSASSYDGSAPSISVEGAVLSLRQSSGTQTATSVDGDLRVFVPDGADARVVVTVLTDGTPPDVRTGR